MLHKSIIEGNAGFQSQANENEDFISYKFKDTPLKFCAWTQVRNP
jgi:hypothetical protein